MEGKKNNKKKQIIKIAGLIGLFLLVFGLSFALFTVTLNGTKKNRITTGTLSLELLDKNGNPIDKMKPSLSTIYELIQTPELTHRGVGIAWFGGVFICILNVLSILFADELFRLNLAFKVRNVENVEPSEWEIAGRYIGWTVMAIVALVLFIVGLQ